MMPPIHDFAETLRLAGTDASLKAQLLKYFKTSNLCPPSKSPLLERTCDLVNWAVRIGRRDYGEAPERLSAVICASDVENALAVWGNPKHDWIVLSEGLIALLQAGANQMGTRLISSHPWVLDTALGEAIQSTECLPGLDSPISSFFYFSAIAFFVGHESGHHVLGHDGYYLAGAHAEVSLGPDSSHVKTLITEQALEFQADRYGVMVARVVMTEWLVQHCDIREYTEVEKTAYQFVLTTMLSAGTLMAATKIKLGPMDWEVVPERTHPPGVLRLVGLSDSLTAAIKASFTMLSDDARRSIRLYAFQLAAEGAIIPGTKEDKVFQERRIKEGNLAALRAIGLLQAIYDPQTTLYMARIQDSLNEVLQQLKPR